jgi:hypothetical protein
MHEECQHSVSNYATTCRVISSPNLLFVDVALGRKILLAIPTYNSDAFTRGRVCFGRRPLP